MTGQLVVTVTTTLCLGLASEGLLHASDTVRVTRLFAHVGLLDLAFPLPTPHAHPPSLGHTSAAALPSFISSHTYWVSMSGSSLDDYICVLVLPGLVDP